MEEEGWRRCAGLEWRSCKVPEAACPLIGVGIGRVGGGPAEGQSLQGGRGALGGHDWCVWEIS